MFLAYFSELVDENQYITEVEMILLEMALVFESTGNAISSMMSLTFRLTLADIIVGATLSADHFEPRFLNYYGVS